MYVMTNIDLLVNCQTISLAVCLLIRLMSTPVMKQLNSVNLCSMKIRDRIDCTVNVIIKSGRAEMGGGVSH